MTGQTIPIHQARVRRGFENAKEGLVEIVKGMFKWCVIIGATIFILF